MKKTITITFDFRLFSSISPRLQRFVDNVVNEVENHSKLEQLAHELFDVIGPRLVELPDETSS